VDGSFEEFVDLRQRSLLRTGWVLTGDWALAEDLVQTALAKTWPRWGRIIRTDDPEVYVRRVMINTWSSWSRRRWRGERPHDELPEQAIPGDLAGDVVQRVAVGRALAGLTSRQRAVVALRLLDDLSEAQTAQILGCAVGTVKSTMSQAMDRLRADQGLAGLRERENH
jgi:RNA polymerase sigma-70 factor (sigma-E family)